jgi:hypothetical protein
MATWWRALRILAATLCVSCVATHPAPEPRRLPLAGEPMYKKPRDLPPAAPDASAATRTLERALVETDAGAILLRALREAGGWDAWLELGDVQVVTSVEAIAPEPQSARRQPAAAIVSPGGAVSVQPEEAGAAVFLALLPFTLGDAAVRLEYLGIEVDHATGEYAEKVRCVRPGAPAGEWHVVAFDRSTWAVRRIVSHEPGGAMALRVASDPVEVGRVRLASRRAVYPLSSIFAHVDLEKPQAVETVSVARGK